MSKLKKDCRFNDKGSFTLKRNKLSMQRINKLVKGTVFITCLLSTDTDALELVLLSGLYCSYMSNSSKWVEECL